MDKKPFGKLADGDKAALYTIENENGIKAEITDYGAALVSLTVKDKTGKDTDVVLGYDSAEEYERQFANFGAIVGRNCNRIKDARIVIDGVTYELEKNDHENNLHSGSQCTARRMWDVCEHEKNRLVLSIVDADGQQGYPGNAKIQVTYELTEKNELAISYHAKADQTTVFNMTSHGYFNLSGAGSGTAMDQILQIRASHYTPLADARSIPTGEIAAVEGTPFDFREPKPIGQDIDQDNEQLKYAHGYDHNFVLDKEGEGLEKVASAYSEKTGIQMDVITDCVGMQLYTANFIQGQKVQKGAVCADRDAFCLETQYFPNAINEPNFPTPITEKGKTYDSKTVYAFSIR
ncbi:MAG: galactose mutarotase [Agathobacter sp.]|nr:galactose mutarotase [Agathobacter sp.]